MLNKISKIHAIVRDSDFDLADDKIFLEKIIYTSIIIIVMLTFINYDVGEYIEALIEYDMFPQLVMCIIPYYKVFTNIDQYKMYTGMLYLCILYIVVDFMVGVIVDIPEVLSFVMPLLRATSIVGVMVINIFYPSVEYGESYNYCKVIFPLEGHFHITGYVVDCFALSGFIFITILCFRYYNDYKKSLSVTLTNLGIWTLLSIVRLITIDILMLTLIQYIDEDTAWFIAHDINGSIIPCLMTIYYISIYYILKRAKKC